MSTQAHFKFKKVVLGDFFFKLKVVGSLRLYLCFVRNKTFSMCFKMKGWV
jgi:hypothetical protein